LPGSPFYLLQKGDAGTGPAWYALLVEISLDDEASRAAANITGTIP